MKHVRRGMTVLCAVAVGASLTGCSDVGRISSTLGGDLEAGQAASALASTISALPGVKAASATYDGLAAIGATVTVAVTMNPTASPGEWGAAASAAANGVGEESLAALHHPIDVSAGDVHVTVEQSLTGAGQDLGTDVSSWRSVVDATDARLSLAFWGAGAQYSRTVTTTDPATAASMLSRWTEYSSLFKADDRETYWVAPGFQFDSTPPDGIPALIGSLWTVAEPVTDHTDVTSGGPYIGVMTSSVSAPLIAIYGGGTDESIAEIIRTAGQSDVRPVTLTMLRGETPDTLTIGCPDEWYVASSSTDLLRIATAAGVTGEGRPGTCSSNGAR